MAKPAAIIKFTKPPRLPQGCELAGIATFVDLFCGIGGFHYAADSLGLRCVFASDIDPEAAAQYERCHRLRPHGDITGIDAADIPRHDLLLAGFPCQPFSIIGSKGGTTDQRGMLFHQILRVLAAHKPRALVLENVKQFATIQNGDALAMLMSSLEGLGYSVDHKVLNALDYGLPQKRERIIIAGLLDGLHNFSWPRKQPVHKLLSELLEPDPDPKYNASERIRKSRLRRHKSEHQPAIWHENKSGNISSHPYSCALRAGASYNYLLVDGQRRLTPRELLRLQGFPESFPIMGADSAIRKQTGNAVPVPMVRAVIKEVLHAAHQNTAEERYIAPALSA